MAGIRLSKAAVAVGSVLVVAAAAIAQDAPGIHTGTAPRATTRPAQAIAQAEQPAARPAESTIKPGEPATRPAKAATKSAMVNNVFVDTDLRQALQDIASQVGVIIIPEVSVSGVVSCELKDVSLDKALEILLAGTSYLARKTPDYYLVCSSDPKSAAFPLISATRLVKLNYVKAAAATKLLPAPFRGYVQSDDETNALSIAAPPALMERMLADIALIDQPTRHVMLDAKIVVMEHDDLLELGIQWGWPQVKVGLFTSSDFHGGGLPGPDWPWGVQIGYTPGKEFTNSLLLTLNLLTQNDNATVLASPQVMAQDGKEAQIAVNTEEYFEIVSQGYYVQSNLQKVESGTLLKITPRIGEKGDITLDMSTEVSDVVGRGEKNLPVITRRIAKSTFRVEDGGTAAVAGLMLSRSRLADSGVPGLTDLPLVGRLFRKDTDSKSSRQVAVFVTARLMPGKDAPVAKPADRPLIKPAGKEFREELRESLRRVGKGKE